MSDYDPRQRRLNPHIQDSIQILNDHWNDLLDEQDYLDRKSRLRIIRQIIDELIDEPEWLEADLQEGPAAEVGCWIDSADLKEVEIPWSGQVPFESPESGGLFFYSDSGALSALFDGDAIDPAALSALYHCGTWIYCLERVHTTAVTTSNRVISANLWRELLPDYYHRTPARDAERYFLLCDPLGIGGGKLAARVAVLGQEQAAIETADALSQKLKIRFLVARQLIQFCTR